MPHTLASLVAGQASLVSEPCGTSFTTPVANIPFLHLRIRQFDVSAGGGPGSNVNITVANPAPLPTAQVGEFILIEEGANRDFTSVVAVVSGAGTDTYTLKSLANAYTTAAKLYALTVFYDKLKVVDPNPSCKEVTTVSLYGHWRDQLLFRDRYAAMTLAEFNFMLGQLGQAPVGAVDDGAVGALICDVLWPLNEQYSCDLKGVVGEGKFNPATNLEDGGPFVSHSCSTFEDQFEDVSGTATFDEYIFEIPFDTFLTRASIHTIAASAADGYVTIVKNDVIPIVDAGPAPPNRNLPAVTGQTKGVDLANIPVLKGDKITVRLNLVGANTVKRAKVVIAHAPRLKNL